MSVLAEFMQMTNLTLAKNMAKNRLSKNSEWAKNRLSKNSEFLKSLPPYIQDNYLSDANAKEEASIESHITWIQILTELRSRLYKESSTMVLQAKDDARSNLT